jgi:hypothetical protein
MAEYGMWCGIETSSGDASDAAEYAKWCELCEKYRESVKRREDLDGSLALCDECAARETIPWEVEEARGYQP